MQSSLFPPWEGQAAMSQLQLHPPTDSLAGHPNLESPFLGWVGLAPCSSPSKAATSITPVRTVGRGVGHLATQMHSRRWVSYDGGRYAAHQVKFSCSGPGRREGDIG